jgi:hypothetical protein
MLSVNYLTAGSGVAIDTPIRTSLSPHQGGFAKTPATTTRYDVVASSPLLIVTFFNMFTA